jgi:spoIIIJ-associated protein
MDDDRVQRGQQWLEELLNQSGVNAKVFTEVPEEHDDGSCWLTIDSTGLNPEQIQALVGIDGAVLDSIQYLANTILNIGKPPDEQQAYTVELNGYRVQRQEELKQIAEDAAHRARETGEEVEIPSLSSAERRQLHTFLKTYDGLETYSRGQEPDRRLVVRLLQESR